jgi:DNA-binding GntR family transcriptional regulator
MSTAETLLRALRDDILSGTLPMGTRLTEAELASTHGVSRQTIKLVLMEMAALGLVDHRPNTGVWVRRMSEADVADLYRVRWLLESEAITQATMDSVSWQELEACVVKLEVMTHDTSWGEVTQADWAFHNATIAATGSQRLKRLHDALEAETLLSFVQRGPRDDVRRIAKVHRDLLSVIRAGDPEAAKAALQFHLEDSRRSLIESRRGA